MAIAKRSGERTRLYRWAAAVGLLAAAEDQRSADIPETNAMGLMAAHASCEAMFGLIIGTLPSLHPSRDDRSFEELLQAAKSRARPRLTIGLIDDLRAMHRTRNAFVHGGTSVGGSDLDRAIEAIRALALHLPLPGHRALMGTATVVADIIQVEIVGMWLRQADRLRMEGRLTLSADAVARALDWSLARTSPRVRTKTRPSVSDTTDRLRAMSEGHSLPRQLEAAAEAINELTRWVLPMAIATSPATYEFIRSVVGHEIPLDTGGSPRPVQRPTKSPPELNELRRATTQVSQIILRLWAIGSLKPGDYDDKLIELARGFVEDPRGYAAGERPAPSTG